MENESTRQSAVEAILERNPNAFRPKIQAGATEEGSAAGTARHNKGCNCKKSGCLKKYCECFQAGIYCGDNCKCIDCKNFEGSEAREAVALTAFQPQDMASRHQPPPHHSPAQNKRQRLAPTHSMHRQQHPPLPAIPVTNRHQPLPAIPEMAARGIPTSRSRSHHNHAPSGELTGHGLSASHSAHQLGGPLGSALSMGANAPVQSSADFLKETMHEMFKRGGLDGVCSLLVSVGHEPVGLAASPDVRSQSQGQSEASAVALHETENAPDIGQDDVLHGNGLTADSITEQQPGVGLGGVSKAYEVRERAVLQEYHVILQKLADRATHKQKEAQQQAPRLSRENSASSSRPPSAPGYADGSQHIMNGPGVAHNSSSNHLPQYPQSGSIQQQQQQPSHHDAASAPQPPVGASFLPPSSSSFLAGNHFGGNSGNGNASIHLPLGVSHVDPDGYLTSPGQPVGSVNPIQTGMGGLTHPSHSGLSNAHQLGFGKPVQTGMGDPNQPGGLYHRGTSGQTLGPRQHMQGSSSRQGSQMTGVSNPLGPSHPASSQASLELRQSAPMLGMQLPPGSVITNPPIQPLTHHSSQLQSQPAGAHFQQQLPSSRAYQAQSFTHALTEASQPLTGQTMHSMASHGSGQGFSHPQGLFSQPLLAQGSGMTSQGFPQPQQVQGSSMQPQSNQSFFSQPHSSQGFYMQPQGQSASARSGQGLASSGLPDGVAHGQSLPDGSAHLPSI
ncbi:hypothetical protein ABBQ32_011268 [Trebouxia sp. C0010 RCD-2024]